MKRSLALAVAVLAGVVLAVPAVSAAPAAKAPVIRLKVKGFGHVLARPDHQALYYWTEEKIRGGKIQCLDSCAEAWPPLLVKSKQAVPKRIRGIRGVFGVVRRPDGTLQVTYKKVPLYTYAEEEPGEVLCNDVDGWFVVRAQ